MQSRPAVKVAGPQSIASNEGVNVSTDHDQLFQHIIPAVVFFYKQRIKGCLETF